MKDPSQIGHGSCNPAVFLIIPTLQPGKADAETPKSNW